MIMLTLYLETQIMVEWGEITHLSVRQAVNGVSLHITSASFLFSTHYTKMSEAKVN